MNALDQNLHILHVHVINSHNICNIYWPNGSINCPSISHAIFYSDSSFNLKDPHFPSKNDYHLGLAATDSHVSQQPVDIICLRNCQSIPDTALPVDNNSLRHNFDKKKNVSTSRRILLWFSCCDVQTKGHRLVCVTSHSFVFYLQNSYYVFIKKTYPH